MLSRVVTAVQMSLIGGLVAGDHIQQHMGPLLPLYLKAKENKMAYLLGLWIFGNSLSQMLVNTGAFEISYNGKLLYSSIEMKRLPSYDELVSAIQSELSSSSHVY